MGLFQKTLKLWFLSLFFLTSALADIGWIPEHVVTDLKLNRYLEHSEENGADRFESNNGDVLIISKNREVLTAKPLGSSEFDLMFHRDGYDDLLIFEFSDGTIVHILNDLPGPTNPHTKLRLKRWEPKDLEDKPSLNATIKFGVEISGQEQKFDEYVVTTWQSPNKLRHVNFDLGHLQFSMAYNDSPLPPEESHFISPIYFNRLQLEFSHFHFRPIKILEPQSIFYGPDFRVQGPAFPVQ